MNPFATLGLRPDFALDKKVVIERKVELNKALHPDRYVGRPATERREALGKSLEVNAAARRLLDPVSRAEALLEMLDCPLSEEGAPQPEAAFLMEIMDLRQSLRDAGKSRDVDRIEQLMQAVRSRRKRTVDELAISFKQVLPPQGNGTCSEPEQESQVQADEKWRARTFALVGELRYFGRFFDEAEAYLDEIV